MLRRTYCGSIIPQVYEDVKRITKQGRRKNCTHVRPPTLSEFCHVQHGDTAATTENNCRGQEASLEWPAHWCNDTGCLADIGIGPTHPNCCSHRGPPSTVMEKVMIHPAILVRQRSSRADHTPRHPMLYGRTLGADSARRAIDPSAALSFADVSVVVTHNDSLERWL